MQTLQSISIPPKIPSRIHTISILALFACTSKKRRKYQTPKERKVKEPHTFQERNIPIPRCIEPLLNRIEQLPNELLRMRTPKRNLPLFWRITRRDDERSVVKVCVGDKFIEVEGGNALSSEYKPAVRKFKLKGATLRRGHPWAFHHATSLV